MSDDETPGIGAGLRRARERKGWTTGDVGSRLRLMSRQVEAIEEEEFSKLGPPVFARGFVRNYAKLLGLDPDELLDQMTKIKTTTVQETETVPFKPNPEWWRSPLVLGGIAAALVAIGIPVGLYLWLSGGEEEKTAPAAIEQVVPPPSPPVAPQIEAQPAQEQSGAAPAQPPQSLQPVAPKANPAPAATPTPAPAKTSGPRLKFEESSWVQIRDGSGRIVLSGLNQAGSTVEVSGTAPFYLVVGNAEHVALSYKGQPIDLKPFTVVNVARLALN